ncbi:hypothetical protein CDD82_2704 [Ophiocordyceps australis]|uniref:DJ-1/PfpI domain-containing protein n=1 Tax=Ophiocordyceps australis TaxID=1399860 RepID=A0A2C5XV61_9HYPO|nr:hypothetical protein CDD82_2704 [Ophiocordyceps australis]
MAQVVILMADYGGDPTETAVPYATFKKAGFVTRFATEAGKQPRCDERLMEGPTQFFLGASKATLEEYKSMARSVEWQHPQSWTAADFSLDGFDLVYIPGGHDKAVRQLLDSAALHKLLVDYFPQTKRPGSKAVGTICHGVLALSGARDGNGRSVLYESRACKRR